MLNNDGETIDTTSQKQSPGIFQFFFFVWRLNSVKFRIEFGSFLFQKLQNIPKSFRAFFDFKSLILATYDITDDDIEKMSNTATDSVQVPSAGDEFTKEKVKDK